MQDILQKLFYSALGFVSLTRENFNKMIKQLVEDRKISQEEGKKLYEGFINNTENRREEFEDQLNKISERIIQRLNLSSRKEMESLEKRMQILEEKVSALSIRLKDEPTPKP